MCVYCIVGSVRGGTYLRTAPPVRKGDFRLSALGAGGGWGGGGGGKAGGCKTVQISKVSGLNTLAADTRLAFRTSTESARSSRDRIRNQLPRRTE